MSQTVETTTSANSTLRGGMVATAMALAAALVVFFVARGLGAGLEIPAQPGSDALTPLALPAVVIVTLGAAIAATAFAWLLTRLAPRRAATIFTVVAIVVLVLSLTPLLALGLATADIVALTVLHVAVGLAIVVPLRSALAR